MKISVSLSDEDVEFLDEYVRVAAAPSRSAVIQRAVGLLRATQLGLAYEEAWDEWVRGGEADAWEPTAADGIAGGRGA
jgi:Arc/MetJ-type ribon-helix-helix transcriptional regulator